MSYYHIPDNPNDDYPLLTGTLVTDPTDCNYDDRLYSLKMDPDGAMSSKFLALNIESDKISGQKTGTWALIGVAIFSMAVFFVINGYLVYANTHTTVVEEQLSNMRLGGTVSYAAGAMMLICSFAIIVFAFK